MGPILEYNTFWNGELRTLQRRMRQPCCLTKHRFWQRPVGRIRICRNFALSSRGQFKWPCHISRAVDRRRRLCLARQLRSNLDTFLSPFFRIFLPSSDTGKRRGLPACHAILPVVVAIVKKALFVLRWFNCFF